MTDQLRDLRAYTRTPRHTNKHINNHIHTCRHSICLQVRRLNQRIHPVARAQRFSLLTFERLHLVTDRKKICTAKKARKPIKTK